MRDPRFTGYSFPAEPYGYDQEGPTDSDPRVECPRCGDSGWRPDPFTGCAVVCECRAERVERAS